MNLFYATILAVIAQALTFLQLQGSAKWGWYEKYPIPVLLLSVPISWCFIKSVNAYVHAYGGEIWPSRLIGFGIGVITFTLMSILIFNETMSSKTLICLFLSVAIILIQVYWK
jgi:hypothetical protein